MSRPDTLHSAFVKTVFSEYYEKAKLVLPKLQMPIYAYLDNNVSSQFARSMSIDYAVSVTSIGTRVIYARPGFSFFTISTPEERKQLYLLIGLEVEVDNIGERLVLQG